MGGQYQRYIHPELDIFLSDFAPVLTEAGADIGVIQFGSSIYQSRFPDQLDIDILLLSSRNHYKDFSDSLMQLKYNMLRGRLSEGFTLNHKEIENVTDGFLNSKKDTGIKFIPKFVFGPITTVKSTDSNFNVYLHFKGPITPDQFIEFGEHFPLHARSILRHSKVLAGKADLDNLNPKKEIQENIFTVFSNSLAIRVTNASSRSEVQKSIKKLLQNFEALSCEPLNIGANIFEILRSKFNVQADSQASIEELKQTFFQLKSQLESVCLTTVL